jgi:hypothetical protein
MKLECVVRGGRYFLTAVETEERWPVLLPGAPPEAATAGMTRAEALRAALLAGFSTREAERAVRKAESRAGPGPDD